MKTITLNRREQRFSPRFATVFLLRDENLWDFMYEVLSGIISAWDVLRGEHTVLILEMSYTGPDRMFLAEMITRSFYEGGMPPLVDPEKLKRAMTQGELSMLIYRLVCGEHGQALLHWYLTALTPKEDHVELPQMSPGRRERCARTSGWRSRRCALSYPPRRSPGDDDSPLFPLPA